MGAPVRVAVVNDVAMCRYRLRLLLAGCEWLEVVAEGLDGHDAIAIRFAADPPDLLLVNGLMRRMTGPAAIYVIRARERAEGLPRVPIVIESVSGDYLQQGIASGADAACGRGGSTEDIVPAIAWAWHSTRPEPRRQA